MKVSDEADEIKAKIKICGRCKFTNTKDAIYCGRCGSALSIETALKEERENNAVDQIMIQYLSDPKHVEQVLQRVSKYDSKHFEEVLHKLLMEDYRKKRKTD